MTTENNDRPKVKLTPDGELDFSSVPDGFTHNEATGIQEETIQQLVKDRERRAKRDIEDLIELDKRLGSTLFKKIESDSGKALMSYFPFSEYFLESGNESDDQGTPIISMLLVCNGGYYEASSHPVDWYYGMEPGEDIPRQRVKIINNKVGLGDIKPKILSFDWYMSYYTEDSKFSLVEISREQAVEHINTLVKNALTEQERQRLENEKLISDSQETLSSQEPILEMIDLSETALIPTQNRRFNLPRLALPVRKGKNKNG